MTAFIVVLHVFVCLFLILFVLLQPGARGGVGAAFGGAGGQTVFGGRGANTFLAKLTAAAAIVFVFTSITLSYFASRGTSVMDRMAKPVIAPAATTTTDATAAPAPEAAAPAAAPVDALPAGDAPVGDAPPATPPAAP